VFFNNYRLSFPGSMEAGTDREINVYICIYTCDVRVYAVHLTHSISKKRRPCVFLYQYMYDLN